MLLDHVGDVGAVAPGEHEAGQAAVRVEGHRERQQRQDQQRPETAHSGVDRQEQGARADRRAIQAQGPGGVVAVPVGRADGRSRGSRIRTNSRGALYIGHQISPL
ncbi:hypothetical protein D3C76_1548430 [compost metagenome]